jgi:hypothetical protein
MIKKNVIVVCGICLIIQRVPEHLVQNLHRVRHTTENKIQIFIGTLK